MIDELKEFLSKNKGKLAKEEQRKLKRTIKVLKEALLKKPIEPTLAG